MASNAGGRGQGIAADNGATRLETSKIAEDEVCLRTAQGVSDATQVHFGCAKMIAKWERQPEKIGKIIHPVAGHWGGDA
jgi:hypothetical protein